MKWKILDSEYVIKRPWLTARKDKVELPDGRIIEEFYVLEYPDWVNVIAITKDGQFVMERQYRHGLSVEGMELPCGTMEDGETPLQAAQRELLEETGYGNGEWSNTTPVVNNQNIAIGGSADVVVGWRWDFNGNQDVDTAAGQTLTNITVKATVTVEQVD